MVKEFTCIVCPNGCTITAEAEARGDGAYAVRSVQGAACPRGTAYVEQELRREVLAAIQDGYTRFISGFAEGADLMFAAIVAEQKEHNPDLFLEAAIPYAGRLKTKNKQFHELLRACDGIKIVCQEYAPSCFLERNRYMAGESQRVIAVYDGRERGGTLFTMRYAHSIGREVREISV